MNFENTVWLPYWESHSGPGNETSITVGCNTEGMYLKATVYAHLNKIPHDNIL